MHKTIRFFWYACFAIFLCAFFPSAALAHQAGLSRGEYRLDGAMLTAELVFARVDAALLVRGLDDDGDGAISAVEVQGARTAFGKAVAPRLVVRAGKDECMGNIDDAFLVEEDGLSLRLLYLCPAPPASVRVRFDLVDDLSFGHRHIARAESGNVVIEEVLFGAQREMEIQPVERSGAAVKPTQSTSFGAFFWMGIEHILLGYDHLVFLFGLVLVGGRWRSLLLVVTAFTLAHSITLGLAVLGVWAPSPRIVEPLIALSVAYVGVENQFVKDADKRWRITFPFGLIHGFGFAGALGEISVPRADVPKALVAFNLGVEAGQLAALAVVLPLVLAARKREWFEKRGVRFLSWAIAGLGIVWFLTRIVGE
ncbi:MAG: HupE/UreJ family protein [Polyangiaceae bacterium]|nr:HupE/UreJ family protein [Polyangiaceae bacterium]